MDCRSGIAAAERRSVSESNTPRYPYPPPDRSSPGGSHQSQAYPPPDRDAPSGRYLPPLPHSTNGFAVASLVLGILWLWWVGSVLALVFGYVARQQIDRSGGMQGGRGMAIAGIVLGWVGVSTFAIIVALIFT